MPIFPPGAERVARVTVSNPAPLYLTRDLSLFLGSESVAVAGGITVQGDSTRELLLPVVMPSVPGTYPVRVFADGREIETIAEDVVITIPAITNYALYVVESPAQVVSGQNFTVTIHSEIPQAELYPEPKYGGYVVGDASFIIQARLHNGGRGVSDMYSVPAGANNIQLQLRSIDWWAGKALPKGMYNVEMRLRKRWLEVVGDTTYTHTELPLGDYRSYAEIEVV